MIRLLHTADLHLGVHRIDRLNTQGQNVMLTDFLAVLDEMIEFATSIDPIDGFPYIDALLISGDIFQHPNPSPTVQQEFARRIQKLIERKVEVVIIPGNHDKPISSAKSDPLQIFRILEIKGCQVFETPELKDISTNRGIIQVFGFPYVSFKTLLSKEKYQGISEEEIGKKYLILIRQIIEKYSPKASMDKLTIFLGHFHVIGSKIGVERTLTMSSEPMLPATSLLFDYCNYIGLGHVHKHQSVYDEPPVVYSGSPQRCDFGEEDEKKGFVEIQWENNKLKWIFHQTHARQYKTLEFNISEIQTDSTQTILDAIDGLTDLTDAIVRVKISCKKNQQINDNAILTKLAQKKPFHIYPLEIKRTIFRRSQTPNLSLSDSFEEAIDQYIKIRKIDSKIAQRVRLLAKEYSSNLILDENVLGGN